MTHGPRFKRGMFAGFGDRASSVGVVAVALQRFQSASSRRSRLVGRPCSTAQRRLGRQRGAPHSRFACGDAFGGLLVQRLRDRRRAARGR